MCEDDSQAQAAPRHPFSDPVIKPNGTQFGRPALQAGLRGPGGNAQSGWPADCYPMPANALLETTATCPFRAKSR